MGIIDRFGAVADTYMREKEKLVSSDNERKRTFIGQPFWPTETLRDSLVFLAMLFVLCIYSWIIPPPLHNAADPFAQAGFVFPDWYVLFSYGYLRWAEYLPQFMVPLGPIGSFFGQPVFPWNAAWWGSLLTGIPIGFLILPPLLGGREARGVENPWAATLGMIYLAHIWFISVFSINIFLDLYGKNTANSCQLDSHSGLSCGVRPPWTAEVFNAIPWVMTGILIWIALYFLVRWFLISSIGVQTTPKLGKRLSLGSLLIAVVICASTWPIYEGGFWDYGGLGAMEDIDELEKMRGQPSDVVLQDNTDFGKKGEIVPAANWLQWSTYQPTRSTIFDFAGVNGNQDSNSQVNAVSDSTDIDSQHLIWSVTPVGGNEVVAEGIERSSGTDTNIPALSAGQYILSATLRDPISNGILDQRTRMLTIVDSLPGTKTVLWPDLAALTPTGGLNAVGSIEVNYAVQNMAPGIAHQMRWSVEDSDGKILRTISGSSTSEMSGHVELGMPDESGSVSGKITLTNLPGEDLQFTAIIERSGLEIDQSEMALNLGPHPDASGLSTHVGKVNENWSARIAVDPPAEATNVHLRVHHIDPHGTNSTLLDSNLPTSTAVQLPFDLGSKLAPGNHAIIATLSDRNGTTIHGSEDWFLISHPRLSPTISLSLPVAVHAIEPITGIDDASQIQAIADITSLSPGTQHTLKWSVTNQAGEEGASGISNFTPTGDSDSVVIEIENLSAGEHTLNATLQTSENQNIDHTTLVIHIASPSESTWISVFTGNSRHFADQPIPLIIEGWALPSTERNTVISGQFTVTDTGVVDQVPVDVECIIRNSIRNGADHTLLMTISDGSNILHSVNSCNSEMIELRVGQTYAYELNISTTISPGVHASATTIIKAYQPLRLYTADGPLKGMSVDLGNASEHSLMGCAGDLDTCSEQISNIGFHKNPKSLDAKLIYTMFIPPLALGAMVWALMRRMAHGYEYEMNKCYGCDLCDDACPVRLFTGGDKLNIIYNTWNNEDDGVPMYSCLTCGACTNVCPQLVDYDSYVDIRRNLMVGGPPPTEIAHSVLQAVLAAEAEEEEDDAFLTLEEAGISSSVGYYPGCVDYLDQEMVFSHLNEGTMNLGETTDAAFSLFDQVGADVAYLGRDLLKCCGHDQKWQGMTEVYEKLKAYNEKKISASGLETLVTSCAECFRTFARDYELDLKVMHTTEFLSEAGLDIKSTLQDPIKVTYHDPCRLGRQMGVYDTPRDLVRNVDGVELVEMEHSREEAMCCGVSSMMSCNEDSRALRVSRFEEVRQTGAEVMLTSCPKCVSHFECLKFEGDPDHDIEILDVVSFLARQISEKQQT